MSKIYISTIVSCLFLQTICTAQTQITNGDFEDWEEDFTTLFEEPGGDFWATLNPLLLLGGPETVTKDADAHSGSYAARLETKSFGTLIISGLLVSGEFITSDPFIIQGQPFTEMPERFTGYYKYSPVNGDSAIILSRLVKYNSTTDTFDLVAEASLSVRDEVSDYEMFDLEFDYLMPGVEPDSIILLLSLIHISEPTRP